MLTIALPKGGIAEQTLEKFEKAFGEKFVFEKRKLILKKAGFTFLNVRNQDVPTYVMYGSADLGVVGLDVLEEKEYDLIKLLDLKIGKCKVAIGLKAGDKINWNSSSKKVATKHLKPNERVGYGATFTADKNMTVSTYNIGYGDGWLRSCATTPYTTEEGLCVLGRVSMDLMSFESSEDEICIMSNAGKAAKHFGTISYEVITSLNSNIEKFVV